MGDRMLQKAAARDALQPGGIVAVNVAGQPVALYDLGGKVAATTNICPHAYCELSENGDVVGDDEVECSCHGSRYRISTGENINPPSADPLTTYPVEVRDGDVYVDLG